MTIFAQVYIDEDIDVLVGTLLLAEELAAQEKQRAEQEKQRGERLAAKLRELNIDPDNL